MKLRLDNVVIQQGTVNANIYFSDSIFLKWPGDVFYNVDYRQQPVAMYHRMPY